MKAYCTALLFFAALVNLDLLRGADEKPFGLDHRVPWTTSRVTGSPEPPLAYTIERTFTKIQWKTPVFITAEPETDYLLVSQQGGEKERPSKLLRFRDDPNTEQVETFLEVSNRLIYSAAFHPGYRTNHQIYVFFHGVGGQTARSNRISRFDVDQELHRCDLQSEHVIIQWHSEGHDGGGVVFGNDGMLYISTGDGTSDSDGWVTGQDLSDLLGGVLRIDVDHVPALSENNTSDVKPAAYSVPKDNPFVAWTNARPELWAYGLRNPWRLAVDRKTGQIWAGNNGQDLWETAHLIRRGENYGWSVYEGGTPSISIASAVRP